METIDFKTFMSGQHKKPKKLNLAFLPVPSVKEMFFNEPVMILFGAGVVIFGLAAWERKLVSQGKDVEAEMVAAFAQIGFTVIGIGGALVILAKVGGAFL